MNRTLALTLGFLRDPFDPSRNVELFARVVEPLLPHRECDHLEDVDVVLEGIDGWRQEFPHLRFPLEADVRKLWPRLGPHARLLVVTHDADHGIRGCAQDAEGEYELAALQLRDGDHLAERVYGALAMVTLPLGAVHAGPTVLRGALRGLRRELR